MRHHPLLSWAAVPRDGSFMSLPSLPPFPTCPPKLSGITFQAVYLHLNPCLQVCLHSFIICVLGCAKLLWRVWLFRTPWTVAWQAPLSMEFFKQESWSGLSYRSPGHLPDPEIEPVSLTSPALAGGLFTSATWEAHNISLLFLEQPKHTSGPCTDVYSASVLFLHIPDWFAPCSLMSLLQCYFIQRLLDKHTSPILYFSLNTLSALFICCCLSSTKTQLLESRVIANIDHP